MDAEAVEAAQNAARLLPEIGADDVAASLVELEAGERRRERGDRRRARVEIRGRRGLQKALQLGRACDEGRERGVRLREPRDEDDVVVALVEVPDDAVPAHAVRAQLAGAALADDT